MPWLDRTPGARRGEGYTAAARRSGGTGRRAGLKIRWGQLRVGSSPTFGTSWLSGTGVSAGVLTEVLDVAELLELGESLVDLAAAGARARLAQIRDRGFRARHLLDLGKARLHLCGRVVLALG